MKFLCQPWQKSYTQILFEDNGRNDLRKNTYFYALKTAGRNVFCLPLTTNFNSGFKTQIYILRGKDIYSPFLRTFDIILVLLQLFSVKRFDLFTENWLVGGLCYLEMMVTISSLMFNMIGKSGGKIWRIHSNLIYLHRQEN